MAIIKHVGKHNARRVVVCYHTVPDEDHMCLVVYSDRMPQLLHDEVMRVLESPAGQNSKDLADALHRNIMQDGQNTLYTLHRSGLLQKVQTEQVIMTPNAQSTIKLNELNKLLRDINSGASATKEMASKIQSPTSDTGSVNTSAGPDSALTDSDLAKQWVQQAGTMRANASSLLAEADRLEAEAATLTEKASTNVISNSAEASQV